MRRRSDAILFYAVDLWVWFAHPKLTRWTFRLMKRLLAVPSVAYPLSMNDKMCWRKVFDRNPLFKVVCDKLTVRDWLKEVGASVDGPRVVWVGDRADDIPEHVWEGNYVLKTSHACGTNHFTEDFRDRRDVAIAALNKSAAQEYGHSGYESGYFGIKGRVFAEDALKRDGLEEIKAYTFGPNVWRVFRSRTVGDIRNADSWERDSAGALVQLDADTAAGKGRLNEGPPPVWDFALEEASKLGAHFDQARVDFLYDGETLWFSEMTLFNQGGFIHRRGHEVSEEAVGLWDLRESWAWKNPPKQGWKAYYFRRLRAAMEEGEDYSGSRNWLVGAALKLRWRTTRGLKGLEKRLLRRGRRGPPAPGT
ncbi:MAG: ATP-grasp fold amidoligase family protein [Pseudomonadota bacterium]